MKVAFLGDSIFGHWNLTGIPGECLNFGRGGETTRQIRERVPDVLAASPEVVFVLAGTNDVLRGDRPSGIAKRVLSIAEAIAPRAHAIVGTVPPMTPRERSGVDAVNGILSASRFDVADFHSALSDHAGLLRADFALDPVHPNEAGYEAMRRVVCHVLSTQAQPSSR